MTTESSQWSYPSLDETTVDDDDDDDRTCRRPSDHHGPWWERMEELAQSAEHDEILQESALLADLAEQNAREMQLALQETNCLTIADEPAMYNQPFLPDMSSLTSTTEHDEEDDSADDFDDCASCCSRDIFLEEQTIAPHATFTIPTADDDADADTDGDEASLVEAVEESCLQASFAEQTAQEMKQVMTWWNDAASPEQPKTPSQKLCLPRNSLVVSSPDAEAYFSPDLLYSPMITHWTKPHAFLPTVVAEDSPLAPRALSNNGMAQAQSFQVDATVEHVEEMKKMVHDLSEGAVVVDDDDDYVASTTQVAHLDTAPMRGCEMKDYLPWRIHAWLRFRHFLELWIWNCMPPDMQLAYVWMAQRPVLAMWMGRLSIMLVSYLILMSILAWSMTNSDNDNANAMSVDYNTVLERHSGTSSVHYAMFSWRECNNIVGEFGSLEVIIL